VIALLLAVALATGQLEVTSVSAIVVDRALAHQVDPDELIALATCESSLDPNAVGDRGTSYGLFQLHRGGLLHDFYADGYTDPFDPWQASDFTAAAVAAGEGGAWSCFGLIRRVTPIGQEVNLAAAALPQINDRGRQ
jgi:hypothetical protein